MWIVDTVKASDVVISRDFFAPMMNKESKGIMVMVIREA